MEVMITGAAGFIGFSLAKKLLKNGYKVTGIDNLNDYYDVNLKKDRLEILNGDENFTFIKTDISNRDEIKKVFNDNKFDYVVNLAAQAGVRYSIDHPETYVDSNMVGFANILEGCRNTNVKHLVYASSSSVYGLNENMPFSVHDNVDHPISLYAASKKANELMAHTYSYLYNLPTTGLRFFTVYGPWGRPDMALFLFTKAIIEDKPIKVFNNGEMKRDFTYIDDIIEGVTRVMEKIPTPDKNWSGKKPDPSCGRVPFKIYNIGNNNTVGLMEFVKAIEEELGKEAIKEFLPLQPGDVPATWANVEDLKNDTGFKPDTPVKEGVKNFINWYKNYYKV